MSIFNVCSNDSDLIASQKGCTSTPEHIDAGTLVNLSIKDLNKQLRGVSKPEVCCLYISIHLFIHLFIHFYTFIHLFIHFYTFLYFYTFVLYIFTLRHFFVPQLLNANAPIM